MFEVWDGQFEKPVNVREKIFVTRIQEPDFRFKERASTLCISRRLDQAPEKSHFGNFPSALAPEPASYP
jgi:hypothetical protein